MENTHAIVSGRSRSPELASYLRIEERELELELELMGQGASFVPWTAERQASMRSTHSARDSAGSKAAAQ
jgi:hypothetical protein